MGNPTTNHDSIKPWARSLLILPAFLFFFSMFQLIGYLILDLDHMSYTLQKTPLQSFIINLFTLLGTFTIVGIFLHFIDKERFISIGFYSKGFRLETTIGLALGISIMTVGFVFLYLINQIQLIELSWDPLNFIFSVFLYVSVAISEELLMRGYILKNLINSMHKMVALIVSAVLFSVIHIFNTNFSLMGFCNITLAGILLGLPYIYTKSLWLPIALHFSWNFFQGPIFGFNVSGHVTYSLLTHTRPADTIWNGGKFGFEGSVLSIVFQVVAILVLWWYYSKRSEQYQLACVQLPDQPLVEN